jgi:fructose-1,6-bisphosphatase/inositol monophosphatase family enzyme
MLVDDALAREIESAAVEMAWGAGEILGGHFGKRILVEYKDKDQRDPVTEVDKSCQEFLSKEINRRFPSHGILGEETPEPKNSADQAGADTKQGPGTESGESSGVAHNGVGGHHSGENKPGSEASGAAESSEAAESGEEPSPDYLWVLDPLDGTTNFLNGLPVYACSIGVLHRGWPVAAALFIPWPNPKGGFVLHCRKGGGCFADDEPVSVYQSKELVANKLIGLPGYFPVTTQFGTKVRSKAGELRTTGSIAYELAMTAIGVMQYSIFGAPRMWDMAGGALAVIEAKGTVMTKFRGEKQWHALESLVPSWETKTPTMKELRGWMAPLIAGNEQLAPLIANNIKPRFRPLVDIRRFSKKLVPKRSKQKGH